MQLQQRHYQHDSSTVHAGTDVRVHVYSADRPASSRVVPACRSLFTLQGLISRRMFASLKEEEEKGEGGGGGG